MKFGKSFGSQMVHEWEGAYMDYAHLKTLLETVIGFRQQNATPRRRKLTFHRAFSGLTATGSSPRITDQDPPPPLLGAGGSHNHYHSLITRLSEEGAEQELAFFNKLDIEFNKVLAFYDGKIQGVKENADQLSRQMDALIALRIKVENPPPPTPAAEAVTTQPRALDRGNQGVQHMDVIQEVEMSGVSVTKYDKEKNDSLRPAPLRVLDHVKINVDPETPVSTIKNVVMSSKLEPSFTKVELRKAEKKLRKAFIEFHHQLRLLKSYSFMNMLAFSKIMKKYDKITSRKASKTYLEIVDMSSLGSSEEVNKLMEKLEAAFIKHFANGGRSEGMKLLRPGERKERHRTTFLLGLLTGSSVALIAAIVVSVYARNLIDHAAGAQYMRNIFPLYSLLGYIVLHMVMFGANTYFWRRLQMDPETEKFQLLTELLPLGLVAFVLLIAFCPFNIIYRSSRFFLIRSTFRCILAPLYRVNFVDFFLADQLTSQIQAIRSLQFYVCYYVWGDFRKRSNTICVDSSTYKLLNIVVAVIPFWLRLLQCLRRVFEERNAMQGLNGLKYLSTVVALVMRSLYDITRQNGNPSNFWRVMAAATSGITTIYSTYWDIVMDWGLLQKNSKNRWLRDKLLIPYKAVYVVAIVVNIILRLVWMQLVLDFNLPFLHRNAMVAVVAGLEILRRGIWNFFRLENEHFNNVENYRAFKSIPLPFYYEEDKTM